MLQIQIGAKVEWQVRLQMPGLRSGLVFVCMGYAEAFVHGCAQAPLKHHKDKHTAWACIMQAQVAECRVAVPCLPALHPQPHLCRLLY